jgi:ankyrin repeat protein
MNANVKRHPTCWVLLLLAVTSVANAGDLTLVEATKNKNSRAVRALLRQQADVNARQGDGATALHWAVYWDDSETADLLIQAGARVNATNDLGVTALYLACENGSVAMVQKLLKAGANPNATLPSGESALMTAARAGSVGVVKALLAQGAKVNAAENTQGQTALMWAAARGYQGVTRVLIDAGADITARSRVRQTRVMGVVSSTRAAVPRNAFRQSAGSLVNEGGFTPLLFAARQGNVESVRFLLAAGANVNDVAPLGTSVLLVAAQSGHGELGVFLLENGADPNASSAGYTPLHAAVLAGQVNLVKALLVHGADPNTRVTNGSPTGRTSKELAIQPSLRGATPFFLAAKFAEDEIMRILVAGGADLLAGLHDGTTPLMVAAGLRTSGFSDNGEAGEDRHGRHLDPGEVSLALSQNEDQRRTLNSGIEAVRLLVELGADVNAINQAGDTALHGAAAHGFETVIRLLIDKGANPNAVNKSRLTPLTTAARGPGKSAVEFLRKLGATN